MKQLDCKANLYNYIHISIQWENKRYWDDFLMGTTNSPNQHISCAKISNVTTLQTPDAHKCVVSMKRVKFMFAPSALIPLLHTLLVGGSPEDHMVPPVKET